MNEHDIAVFGSAFNPPHLGHADVIEQVRQHTSHIVLVPSYQHAFGKSMLPFQLRLAMLKAMLRDLNNTHWVTVSEIEQELASQRCGAAATAPIYTYDVLAALEQVLGTSRLVFVVGPDNAAPQTWRRFYRAKELTQRWQLWAAEERLAIRSSAIRQTIAEGGDVDLRHCTPGVIELLKGVDVGGE